MSLLSTATKARLFLGACVAWLVAGGWLIGCVVADASTRQTAGAVVAVVLSSLAVFFIKNALDLEATEARVQELPKFYDPRAKQD